MLDGWLGVGQAEATRATVAAVISSRLPDAANGGGEEAVTLVGGRVKGGWVGGRASGWAGGWVGGWAGERWLFGGLVAWFIACLVS